MFKRYLGITLIAASLTVVGCSSSDDDDDVGGITNPDMIDPETMDPEVTDPETTDPEVTDPETTDPEVTDPETTDPEVTAPETTDPAPAPTGDGAAINTGGGNLIFVTNAVNATGGAQASLHVVHSSDTAPVLEGVLNDQIEEPLIGSLTDPGSQLSFGGRSDVFLALDPVSNKLDLINDYYADNRSPAATVNMEVEAGSSTLVVARGAGDEFELIAFAAEPADPDLAKLRLVHGARGFAIQNASTCGNCATADLDIYVQTTDLGAEPSGEPVPLSYASQSTGYVSVAPALYNVFITESGNIENVRLGPIEINLTQGTVTTIVARDDVVTGFGSALNLTVVDDLRTE